MTQNDILNIVVAGGSGHRFGSSLPKQFHLLGGKPVLVHSIERLLDFGRVVLVLSPDYFQLWDKIARDYGLVGVKVVRGGDTRWASVKNAVSAFGSGAKIITVHDAARPLLARSLIDRLITAVGEGKKAVVPVVGVSDSLRKRLTDGTTEAVSRSGFCAVQTPQAFAGDVLRAAYELPYSPAFTDDASVVESMGVRVDTVEGYPENIKITNSKDIFIAEALMRQWND